MVANNDDFCSPPVIVWFASLIIIINSWKYVTLNWPTCCWECRSQSSDCIVSDGLCHIIYVHMDGRICVSGAPHSDGSRVTFASSMSSAGKLVNHLGEPTPRPIFSLSGHKINEKVTVTCSSPADTHVIISSLGSFPISDFFAFHFALTCVLWRLLSCNWNPFAGPSSLMLLLGGRAGPGHVGRRRCTNPHYISPFVDAIWFIYYVDSIAYIEQYN